MVRCMATRAQRSFTGQGVAITAASIARLSSRRERKRFRKASVLPETAIRSLRVVAEQTVSLPQLPSAV